MKELKDYTIDELSIALLKKQNEIENNINKKEISDANDILEFVKGNKFFMFSYPSKCSTKLYEVGEQLPKINEYNNKEVKINLNRSIEINGNYKEEIMSMDSDVTRFRVYSKKYNKLPKDYRPEDDDGNDSNNPSYFWPKISSNEKKFLVPISEEIFEKFWKMSINNSHEIDLLIEDIYNKD